MCMHNTPGYLVRSNVAAGAALLGVSDTSNLTCLDVNRLIPLVAQCQKGPVHWMTPTVCRVSFGDGSLQCCWLPHSIALAHHGRDVEALVAPLERMRS